jgi:hypothetical protein
MENTSTATQETAMTASVLLVQKAKPSIASRKLSDKQLLRSLT